MELFTHPLTAAVVALAVLIFVHESGHFLVGRACGIAVEIFSIGFGPPLLTWRRGLTEYRLSWIPLGGFVKFYGMLRSETVPPEVRGKEFMAASQGRRVATVAAGPLANLLLAVIAYATLGFTGIPHPKAFVGEIQRGSAAEAAGLQFGDLVVSIDGAPIKTWVQMREIVSRSPDKDLQLGIDRRGKNLTIKVKPQRRIDKDLRGNDLAYGVIGVAREALSSTVQISQKDKAAYEAGLRSADLIEQAVRQNGTEIVDVKLWRAFSSFLREEVERGAKKITLKVRALDDAGEVGAAAEVRSIELDISKLKISESALKQSTLAVEDDLLEQLGMTHAQLTFGNTKKVDEHVAAIVKKTPLQARDWLREVDGKAVGDIYQLTEQMSQFRKDHVNVKIVRDFKVMDLDLELVPVDVQRPEGKVVVYTLPLGFLARMEETPIFVEQYANPVEALWFGLKETSVLTGQMVYGLYKLLIGDVPLGALGGPMLIAKVAGDSARMGWKAYLSTLAMISINLGVLNLFPIPALDGGQLVIFAIESIRRRRLSEAAIENFQRIGFVMIMALVVLATYNDLSRFWTSMLRSVTGVAQ